MTAIERIHDLLEAEGYEPTLAAVEGKPTSISPLIVPFRPDAGGREMALFIEVMPREAGETTSLINFSLIYPYELYDAEHLGELVRALFLLNRYVPVGSHGLCEQTPAVYFFHALVVSDAETVDEEVIRETVNMIGFTTRRHGPFIRRVLTGEANCDNLLEELAMTGELLPPLFARTLRDSEDAAAEQSNG